MYKQLTGSREAQLSTGHTCIHTAPWVITDCAPHSIAADFHTAFIGVGPTNQSEVSAGTGCEKKKYCYNISKNK